MSTSTKDKSAAMAVAKVLRDRGTFAEVTQHGVPGSVAEYWTVEVLPMGERRKRAIDLRLSFEAKNVVLPEVSHD